MPLKLLLLLMIAPLIGLSQKKAASSWHYSGLYQGGILIASKSTKASLLTTQGIEKGTWFTGITTGYDWYGIHSIPVMGSVYKSFGNKTPWPYLFASAGINFPKKEGSNFFDGRSLSKASYVSGFTGEAGAGYFFSLHKKLKFSFSVAYSYKNAGFSGTYSTPYIVYGNYYYTDFTNRYHYRRIAVRIGLKL